jgi:hypothetical protein
MRSRGKSSIISKHAAERSIGDWDIDRERCVGREVVWQGTPITTWAQFHRIVKRPERALLERLDEFPNSVLVAGCQRSGTTAVARMLMRAREVVDHTFGHDDELDAALLLAGYVERFTTGKHCFQTTYLNDRFHEYFDHDDFRLIWILREPRAVVYSMLHNWKRGALNRLFDASGSRHIAPVEKGASILRRWFGPSRLDKACASYVAKTEQTFALRERLGARMLIVDYEDLVARRISTLRSICAFAEVNWEAWMAGHFHGRSLRKRDALAAWQAARIDAACAAIYTDARTLRAARGFGYG